MGIDFGKVFLLGSFNNGFIEEAPEHIREQCKYVDTHNNPWIRKYVLNPKERIISGDFCQIEILILITGADMAFIP